MDTESSNSGNNSPPVPPRPPKRNKPYSANEEFAKTISSELNSRLSSLKKAGPEVETSPSKISEAQYDIQSPPPPVPPRRENLSINYEETNEIIGNYEADYNEDYEENEHEENDEVKTTDKNKAEEEYNYYSNSDNEHEKRKSSEELLNEKIEDLAEENNELLENIREMKRSLKDKTEDNKKLNNDNKKLAKEVADLKANKDEQVQKLKEKILLLMEKLEELNEKNKKLESENSSLKTKFEEMSKMKSEEVKDESNKISVEIPPKPLKPEMNEKTPITPPKPSKHICQTMIQNANTDEYDLEPIRKSSQNKSNENISDVGESIELLPGTSSRPLVLPTKTCVRKRGLNRNSTTASVEKKMNKKYSPNNLTEEPLNIDDDKDEMDKVEDNEKENSTSSKHHNDSTVSEDSPRSVDRPALPPRSSERVEKKLSVDNEMKNRLEKMKKPVRLDSPVPQNHINNELANPTKKRSYIYEVSTIESIESMEMQNSNENSNNQINNTHTNTSTSNAETSTTEAAKKKELYHHIPKTTILDSQEFDGEKESPVTHESVKRHSTGYSKVSERDNDSDYDNRHEENEEGSDDEKEGKEFNDDDDDGEKDEVVEPEISATLSKIQKIGRGIPSLLPHGALTNIKLRSRKEEARSSRQCGLDNLDEDGLKKWIFTTLGKEEKDGNLFALLHDGILLCELINSIRKDKQIQTKSGRMRAWHIVNINAYLSGCIDLQLKTLFKAEDLYEEEGLDKIIKNLNELRYYSESKK